MDEPRTPSQSLTPLISMGFIIGVHCCVNEIHSFDMGSEQQFGEMQLPNIPNEHWKKLTLRGDSLAMLAGPKLLLFNLV
ncbi:hypothetical protein KY284_020971 [Solanum tuberosum]|nr:hypothetical protein KY284_020971 [Solanum tuberosum]